MTTLADLKIGEKAVIRSFTNPSLSRKLIEMGCLPGETVSLSKIAPLGCPVAIDLGSYELSLRREEAKSITVELLP